MKSLFILTPLICLIFSPTSTIGGWPKPSEVSSEEMLMKNNHHHYYVNKFSFGDSKVWKCVHNNGSGGAVSISYPGSQQPPPPSKPSPSPQTPRKSPPPPKPLTPPPTSKMSPPPPKPSPSPPPKPSTPPPAPKMSPPPPKQTPPPTKASPPPPKPSTLPPPHTPSMPPSKPSPPAPTHDMSPPPPATPRYQDPMAHFLSCVSEMAPSAECKQQMEVSYYTRSFRVSDYCCNLIVNMRHECTDVILGFFTDPFFVPLLRCTCYVKC